MPRGPQGQWRPVSDVACATRVMKIATGEIEEKLEEPLPPLPESESEEDVPLLGSGLPIPTLTD